ncbi:hypothetical protein ACHOLT_07835 [Desulfitobacterium sp. Sab5]
MAKPLITLMLSDSIKKTWLSPEDTVFALVSFAQVEALVALIKRLRH